jgi:hypothetical protein
MAEVDAGALNGAPDPGPGLGSVSKGSETPPATTTGFDVANQRLLFCGEVLIGYKVEVQVCCKMFSLRTG